VDACELQLSLVRVERGRPVYRLTKPVKWRCVLNDVTIRVRVPLGYETDLASIPWPISRLLSPGGPWAYAAVIHDWLCDCDGVERAVADAIFWQVMGESPEIGRFRRVLIYCAVRAYWICWRRWGRSRTRKLGDEDGE
jgi:hypothetical protein